MNHGANVIVHRTRTSSGAPINGSTESMTSYLRTINGL
jgi:hypothetical protein